MKKKGLITLILLISFMLPLFSFSHTVSAEEISQDPSLEDIKERGVLIIGTSADFPPYEFHATVAGKDTIVGMDISIAQKIADDLGVELQIEDMQFDSLIPALETGNVDMILAGMSATDERKLSVDFSDIYYEATQNLVIRSEDKVLYSSKDDLAGKIVGAQMGSIQEKLAKTEMVDSKLISLGTTSDLLLALKTNKIDAIVMEGPNALAFTGVDDTILTFEGGFEGGDTEGSSIAMSKGSDSLMNVVNTSLAEIEAEKLIPDYLAQAGTYLETAQGSAATESGKSSMTNYWSYFMEGTLNTIFISVVSVIIGSFIGVLLALVRLSNNKFFSFLATAYVEFVRGTPMMIQVMFIYFAVGYLINIPAMLAGIIAVSLNSGAYVCEIIRSGLSSVPTGQVEAARSLGMGKNTALRHIIFPQALKNIWPALGNEFVTIIKESSIVSVIGVSELIFQTRVVTSVSYRGIAPLAVSMVIYFILTFSLTKLLNYYEGKMSHD
ncbi:ABC transporter substrate-binding protein/permease [Desemzia sp. RIT804]|uniref:ABC transporter substrate-binding protein/permease n=1 Tax=Desemzia sp. RIT 804 TaxID=2810209 RepID=UPI00194FBF5E|nr:ABC transporter substrate-binding protein/permease [Desemzia sp. RIT 804]MBM6613930.1 ABC transporter substrate-binding protein/permease [Desemzia sp. RIT 804]